MSDNLRQDATDKVGSAVEPDSQKSTTEQVSEQAKGAGDSIASTLQPEGDKSTSQQATDSASGGASDAGNTAGDYMKSAQESLGLGSDSKKE